MWRPNAGFVFSSLGIGKKVEEASEQHIWNLILAKIWAFYKPDLALISVKNIISYN